MCDLQLKESCCGCKLRTGTQTIGWIQLVLSAIIMLLIRIYGGVNDQGLLIFVVVFTLVYLGFALCLLFGVDKESTGMILAWLIFNLIITLLNFVANIYVFAVLVPISVEMSLIELVKGIIPTFLHFYMMLVVYSYYKEIKARLESAAVCTTDENLVPNSKDPIDAV